MNQKLRNLIDKNSENLSDWVEAINQHNSMFDFSKEFADDERTNLTYGVSEVLGKISEMYFQFGAFKDSFDNSKMYLNLYGPEVIIKSKKIGSNFYLGLGQEGIYIRTWMKYGEHLRHMDDTFYQDIFTLADLGEFDIEQTEFYGVSSDEKYKKLYSNNKSKIFKLLRNYMVGIIEEERDVLLGDFKISWNYQTNFEDIICNGCLAFKLLYRLNYSLWKIEDTKSKKAAKKRHAFNFN